MNIFFSPLWQENEIKSSVPQTEISACKMPGFSSKNFLRSNLKKKKKGFPYVLGTFKQFLFSWKGKRILCLLDVFLCTTWDAYLTCSHVLGHILLFL